VIRAAHVGLVLVASRENVAQDGYHDAAMPGLTKGQDRSVSTFVAMNRRSVEAIVAESLAVHESSLDAPARRERVRSILQRVGLDDDFLDRYPHQLSGGEAQRVAIARALILSPKVLVCDEAVAALDGTVRAEILKQLAQVQGETGLAIIFISHDLAVVRSIAHRVLVMYLGALVELGANERVFEAPRHPYTRALLAAVPVPDPAAPGGRSIVKGETPSAVNPPSGCSFHPRCSHAIDTCRTKVPAARTVADRLVSCHRADESLP